MASGGTTRGFDPRAGDSSVARPGMTYCPCRAHDPGGVVAGPGDIYEDCSFHPALCTFNDGDQIQGISLVDATAPRACSIGHCAVIKLSIADVIAARADWSTYL